MSAWSSEISPERRSARLKLMMAVALVGFLACIARLVDIQLLHHREYARMASHQHTTRVRVEARRGRILDRNGYLMAGNRTVAAFQVFWPQVPKGGEAAVDSFVAGLGDLAVVEPGDRCGGNMILAGAVAFDTAMELAGRGLPPGVSMVLRQVRTYPMGDLAAGIIGRYNGESSEGVERWFDDELSGEDGNLYMGRSGSGKCIMIDPDADNVYAVDGTDIMLTIDARFQCILVEELEKALEEYGGAWAAAVLVDPRTGEILAAGSVPVRAENSSLAMNHCFQGYHEPGSTFKVVTYAACIEEGLIAPDEMFDCSKGFIEVAGELISDSHRLGVLGRDEVMINSSNVGTVMMAEILGDTTLVDYCRRLGFGLKSMVEYPDESRGILPEPGSAGWSGVSLAQLAIGQEVVVTPLQLAMAYTTIANGGILYYPRLLHARLESDRWIAEKSVVRSTPFSTRTAEVVRRTLRAVVEEGTGTTAALAGVSVGGKTGTAERLNGDTGYLSAFVGLVPAEDPNFVLAVIIDGPDYVYRWGSASAAPTFARMASRIISTEPELALSPVGEGTRMIAAVTE